mgnify:CR=1 FL=1
MTYLDIKSIRQQILRLLNWNVQLFGNVSRHYSAGYIAVANMSRTDDPESHPQGHTIGLHVEGALTTSRLVKHLSHVIFERHGCIGSVFNLFRVEITVHKLFYSDETLSLLSQITS